MKKDFPMKRTCLFLCLLLGLALGLRAQFRIDPQSHEPVWSAAGRDLLTAPDEGLWGVALGWSNNWMTDWKYARPEKVEQSGEWTVVSGRLRLPQGDLLLRDAYRPTESGGVECRRRFEWTGRETLHTVSLSVRLRLRGERLQAFLPGTLYYGNKNGARINAGIIPVYNGEPGELAVFEDHRYPMPFAMLESAEGKYAAAVHTTPSPVRGAVLQDQWWSLGVEAGEGYSDFVLYSGPIGYNRRHSLKDQRLKDLARVMFRSCYQLTDIYGSQGEQLQQTNFAQHGDMSNVYRLRGGYSEGWTVFWITAHVLSAAAQFVEMGVTS